MFTPNPKHKFNINFTFLPSVIPIDEEYDNDEVNNDVNAWQNEYENSSADQNDGGILEFEIGDSDISSHSDDVYYSAMTASETVIVPENHNHQINEGGINLLESLLPDLPDNQYPPFLQEVEIETVSPNIIVSSSTTRSDESGSRSLIEDLEDEHFVLALMRKLQRIPPLNNLRAKVEILTYLTELEYWPETLIN